VVLRNDTSVSISNEMYKDFSFPYEQKITSYFGQVSFHYCGKDVPWFDSMLDIDGCKAINVGRVPGLAYGLPYLQKTMEKLSKKKQYLSLIHLDEDDLLNSKFIELYKQYGGGFSVAVDCENEDKAKRFMYIWILPQTP